VTAPGRICVVAAALAAAACNVHAPLEQTPDVYVPQPAEGGIDAGDDAASADAQAPPGTAIDRAAHPFTTVLLVPGPLQDPYNAEPSFAPNGLPRVLQGALEARLEQLDTLALGDGGPDKVDWPVPEGGVHPLLPLFATDILLVDTALSCTQPDGGFATTYLDLDREIYLSGPRHATCGGRTPAEDVASTTWTLLVTGGRDGGPPVSQGGFGPTKAPATTFPYLAPPN
jgi:hypothetical protein